MVSEPLGDSLLSGISEKCAFFEETEDLGKKSSLTCRIPCSSRVGGLVDF